MFKLVIIASFVSMVTYALVSGAFEWFGWYGGNDLETQLIHIVLPLAISICVVFLVFGLVIRVKRKA